MNDFDKDAHHLPDPTPRTWGPLNFGIKAQTAAVAPPIPVAGSITLSNGFGLPLASPMTTRTVDAPLMRLLIEPSERNGLRASHLMIDKITTVSKTKLESRVGRLSGEDVVRVNRALIKELQLRADEAALR